MSPPCDRDKEEPSVVPPHQFQWERLPAHLVESVADFLGLVGSTATAQLAEQYGTPPDAEFVRETWDVLRDEWLPQADTARSDLVAALWELGVGFADDYPVGR